DLIVVRVVNDLPLRNELRGSFGEFLHQYCGQGEVAAGEDTAMLLAGDGVDLCVIALGNARRPHDYMRAVSKCGQDVGLGAIRFRVFDEDIAGIGERFLGRSLNGTSETGLRQSLSQASARVLARDCSDEGK